MTDKKPPPEIIPPAPPNGNGNGKPAQRQNGGRPLGATSKASVERLRAMQASGPEFMDAWLHKLRWHLREYSQEIAKGAAADKAVIVAALDKACEAARDGAPYVYNRLASVSVNAHHTFDLSRCTDEELDDIERILSKAASVSGRYPEGTGETLN